MILAHGDKAYAWEQTLERFGGVEMDVEFSCADFKLLVKHG